MKRYQNDKVYFAQLDAILDDIFAESVNSYNWSWFDLAIAAKLAISTVYNLGNRKTRYPRFITVYKLAQAVGMELRVIVARAEAKRRAG